MTSDDHLPEGLYDRLIDRELDQRVGQIDQDQLLASINEVPAADIPKRVSDVVSQWVEKTLRGIDEKERATAAIDVASGILAKLDSLTQGAYVDDGDEIIAPLRRLDAIERKTPNGQRIQIHRPLTPIADTVLLTNARGEPSVGAELKAEIDSADRIDIVLAFIRWTGIRDLLEPIKRHISRGRKIRILTTTYTGSTEVKALRTLKEVGVDIKVSYDTRSTRLHAKAWLFHRETGHSTVYIGSSNLTYSAQVTGKEWNVRASEYCNPDVIRKFKSSFETYWASKQFEPYEEGQFALAVKSESRDSTELLNLDITPYHFQRDMLERIQGERQLGRPHTLVVAATGTGKTIMAALDFKHLKSQLGSSRLLFIAHRKEILRQSRNTFRHVLRNGSFGEEWVDGRSPQKWEHVFASIQSLSASQISAFPPDHFDIVIIDEFHHAAASTYEEVLDYLEPKHLIGLTATPERTDGLDILKWFGGRIAAELRLWDALEDQLLSPFHYFGISDATDLSRLSWTRAGYKRSELTDVYTRNDLWLSKVLDALHRCVADPQQMRALGFCVTIEHAQFMASRFNEHGIRSNVVTSRTRQTSRDQSLIDLQDGKINAIFTVDIFNEGVDIPEIDTVMMLRPTESATIFLQQLGRGLRKSDGKQVLTVLDFVGHQHSNFRFDRRFGRLLGRSRKQIEGDVDKGFPFLPAGCQINLDPVARDIVLSNIRASVPATFPKRVEELRGMGNVGLAQFIDEAMIELSDVYAASNYWTKTRRRAGFVTGKACDQEAKLGRGIGRLLHMDDKYRLESLRPIVLSTSPPVLTDLTSAEVALLNMLMLTLFSPRKSQFESIANALNEFWSITDIRNELSELIEILLSRVTKIHDRGCENADIPLRLHASYRRTEVLAAYGISTVARPVSFREGVYFHKPTKTDLLFVTMDKSSGSFSQSTRYRDFAISENEFHWESQSDTRLVSETGQRYVTQGNGDTNVMLFVRESTHLPDGRSRPFVCAGSADYLGHEGERPIAITWRLRNALPGGLFASLRAAVT